MKRIMYVTGVMKGRDALRMIAECKAQETIRVMTTSILNEHSFRKVTMEARGKR